MSDDSTVLITDIKKALAASENEASSKNACLIVVGGDLNGTIVDLPNGTISIGRGLDCNVVLEFKGISRKHVQLTIAEESVTLSDAGSANGTFLNNSKLKTPAELKKGDIVKLGSIALKFIPKGDPERLAYDKLNEDANTDALTKCYNKRYFINSLELEVKKSKVTGAPLTLIFFDLDHFKNLNDTYGHDAGDYVLRDIAEVIRKSGVRIKDVFGRYGGEEFGVVLPETNIKQGFEIAERIRKSIDEYEFIYSEHKLPVTASFGIADYRQGVSSGVALLKRADEALYKSKEGGRNCCNFFRE